MIRERRVPTLIVMVLLLLGVAAGVALIQIRTRSGANASPDIQPLQVEVSNVTHNSFTLSWVTQGPANGIVAYGEDEEAQFLARDKRDIFDQKLNRYTTHWVQVVGLSPNRQYFFYIKSDNQRFDNGGNLYTVTTAEQAATPQANGVTAYGTVKDETGKALEGAVVLLGSGTMAMQSTITDPEGRWSLNLSGARSKDLKQSAQLTDESVLEVRVQGGAGSNTTAKVAYTQLAPMPDLQLGRTYDFLSIKPSPSTAESGPQKSQFGLIPQLGAVQDQGRKEVTIWNPQENEALATNQPLFIGQAPAGVVLNVTLDAGANQVTGTAQVDDRGNWQWPAPKRLADGEHVVTASYTDQQKVQYQQSRVFTIVTGSTMPAIESTPSATITTSQMTPTPTRTSPTPTRAAGAPSATPTRATSVTPTKAATTGSPTPTLKAEVSGAPTATRTPTPSGAAVTGEVGITGTPTPTPSLPKSGATLPTLGLAGLGAIILFVGVALLL